MHEDDISPFEQYNHEVEINIEHPLEDVLGIDPGTTTIARIEHNSELATIDAYDDKDSEVDDQFQNIYDAAISAYETQLDEAEMVEGKYKSRSKEVAVQFLNTALAAAREKAALKQHKDKVLVAQNKIQKGSNTTNNTLIIADRNEILKQIKDI